MQDLKIALFQFAIEWQNPAANRTKIESKINGLKEEVDLIVLPEMFTTAFTMEVETNAEQPEGKTLKWMRSMASSTGAIITGSIIVNEENKYYNRLLWVTPDGDYKYYDKRHLFRMANEGEYFSQGTEAPIFNVKGWNVKPLICYDLRFPVWSRNKNADYDLLLYVANWPAPRINAWDALLKARAIENMSYSAGVNRVGKDGADKNYLGHTACYNFKGEMITGLTEKEEVIITTLSKSALDKFRTYFPAHLDADNFNIQ